METNPLSQIFSAAVHLAPYVAPPFIGRWLNRLTVRETNLQDSLLLADAAVFAIGAAIAAEELHSGKGISPLSAQLIIGSLSFGSAYLDLTGNQNRRRD